MGDDASRRPGDVLRLSGGELLIHADAAPILAELVEIAVRAEPRLHHVDTDRDRRRVALIRDLRLGPISPTVSQRRSNETVVGADPSSSAAPMTVEETAKVLNVSRRRVQQLLASRVLTGERDGDRHPWRTVHPDSVAAYAATRQDTP